MRLVPRSTLSPNTLIQQPTLVHSPTAQLHNSLYSSPSFSRLELLLDRPRHPRRDMLSSQSSQGHFRTSSRDTNSSTNSKAFRQRLSRHLQRPLSSATSLSSLSSKSISTKSIKFKTNSSIWASVSATAHRVFNRSSSSRSLHTLASGVVHSPTLA